MNKIAIPLGRAAASFKSDASQLRTCPLTHVTLSPAPAARRVYDALNVLEALDIISKEKKSVKWKGFPETQAAHHFAVQQTEAQARQVELKQQKLRALIGQLVAFRQLIERNKARERGAAAAPEASSGSGCAGSACAGGGGAADDASAGGAAGSEAGSSVAAAAAAAAAASHGAADVVHGGGGGLSSSEQRALRIHMPFFLVQTQTPSVIDCAISDDRLVADLTFEHSFSVHDDSDVLHGLNLHVPKRGADLTAMGVPAELVPFAKGESARSIRLDANRVADSSRHGTAAAVDMTATASASSGATDCAAAAGGAIGASAFTAEGACDASAAGSTAISTARGEAAAAAAVSSLSSVAAHSQL